MKKASLFVWLLLGVALAFLSHTLRIIVTLTFAFLYFWLRPLPPSPERDPELRPNRRGICTDRYQADKVPGNLDAIVIGSGLSGLTAAAVLARMGKKVLVLEQHDRTGGGSHAFTLGSGYTFDSGMHYLVPESGLLLQLATGSAHLPVPCDLMGENPTADGGVTYDRIVLEGCSQAPFDIQLAQHHMPALYAAFPQHKADIDRYVREAQEAVKSIPIYVLSRLLPWAWQKRLSPWLLRTFHKHASRSQQEALQSITSHAPLASLLGSLWIDTGSPPDRATWILSAAVFHGFPQRGGAYPRGGSQGMSGCLVPVVERAGGRVLVRADVTEILLENHDSGSVNSLPRVVGVRLHDGNEIRAPLVISSAGYNATFGKLLPAAVSRGLGYPSPLPHVPPSAGFVMCNIGIRGNAEELGIKCSNLWSLPTLQGDMFAALKSHFSNPLQPELVPMMITFPSVKDRGHAHPDRTTCQILVLAEGDSFRAWCHQPSGQRDVAYQELKATWQRICVDRLLKYYPQLRECIDFVDVSTPLTIEHYLRAEQGGAVGLDQIPRRFTDMEIQEVLDMRTRIPGLWMTGQDTLICGQPLVQLAGLITALRILGPVQGLRFFLQNVFYEVQN
eukprot:TRINITY_DN9484_c0_g1_i1.p1 TRINITY_DN9484_c0_g1~~TRINITY_DN9484_c0_g1_i1.p1  ORF type:complete len:617 (-),score=87.31 TRINITY_DN9484_c0_g1_i1:11-1861(-)